MGRSKPIEHSQNTQATAVVQDEFLATLNHELRTPLTNILGWTHLLRTGQLDDAASERALETIERNARMQIQQIDDLLDMSRITTGALQVDMQQIELQPVICRAAEAIKATARTKGVDIQMRFESHVDPVRGDAMRLQQAFWHLLSNGVKFTPTGGRVEIALTRAWPHARITVSDTGRGISPEFLPHVFDRFRQADKVTTRKSGGLGLGLAMVRELVHLHGGTIQAVSSGEGQGAVFAIEIPFADVHVQGKDTLIAAS